MTTHRSDILNELAAGNLTADEAAARLRHPAADRAMPSQAADTRMLRVRITQLDTGRRQTEINLPLTWVKAGLVIGARYKPEIANIDFNDLIAQIQDGTQGKLIEVEDLEDNERVEIYVE